MSSRGHVLVTGASIAGPAVASWLRRHGFDVTVLERAPRLRPGGQNVDVRGAGREVARRMGLEDAIRAATTGEQGLRFVDADGASIGDLPAGTSDSDGATAELEILRGDLARLLVEHSVASGAVHRWGDEITAVDQDDDGVTVTFAHAEPERFDLVVVAEGIRSRTRALVLGDEPEVRELGLRMAWLTIPRTPEDDDWWRWYNAPGGRVVSLRPDPVGTIRATLSHRVEPGAAVDLRERFADAGWAAARVLEHLDDADGGGVYDDEIGQVHAPRWSVGRVVLLGDAGYCPSPVSGMGTSVSLVGAYVLAGELAAHVDHRDAFAAYDRVLRPYVEQAQDLPPGVPRVAHPVAPLGVAALRLGVRVITSRVARALAARFTTPPAEKITLPDYAHLLVR